MNKQEKITYKYDGSLVKKAAYASVCVAAVLIAIKFFAWHTTNSLSLQATLIDSLLDAVASVINMLAIRHAHRPPNDDYRFGHGKSEALAAIGQSLFIVASAMWLIYEGFHRLFNHEVISGSSVGIVVMVISMALTYILLRFQKHVIERTNSAAIKADSVHYHSDFLINGGVIISLTLSFYFHLPWFDALFGMSIALYILYTAWQVSSESFGILMDKELEPDIRDKIIAIATKHPEVHGTHQVKTRSSGFRTFIQLHLELDGAITLADAHKIADEVENDILKAFPEAEVIIHEDPIGLTEHPSDLRNK